MTREWGNGSEPNDGCGVWILLGLAAILAIGILAKGTLW